TREWTGGNSRGPAGSCSRYRAWTESPSARWPWASCLSIAGRNHLRNLFYQPCCLLSGSLSIRYGETPTAGRSLLEFRLAARPSPLASSSLQAHRLRLLDKRTAWASRLAGQRPFGQPTVRPASPVQQPSSQWLLSLSVRWVEAQSGLGEGRRKGSPARV